MQILASTFALLNLVTAAARPSNYSFFDNSSRFSSSFSLNLCSCTRFRLFCTCNWQSWILHNYFDSANLRVGWARETTIQVEVALLSLPNQCLVQLGHGWLCSAWGIVWTPVVAMVGLDILDLATTGVQTMCNIITNTLLFLWMLVHVAIAIYNHYCNHIYLPVSYTHLTLPTNREV